MRFFLVLAMVAAAVWGCAQYPGCPGAQLRQSSAYEAQPLAAYSGSTEGTVESVEADLCSLTLRERDGGLKTVQLTGQTLVVSEAEPRGERRALAPGQKVRVSYQRYGRSMVADQVEIVTGAAPPPARP